MLKPLLRLRLAALGAWLSGATRQKGRAKRPALRIVLLALLLVYALACFCFLFYVWFGALAEAWSGGELAWLYFALLALASFAVMFFFSIFTAKEQLFAAKDNDLLLSLPLSPAAILLSRMLELIGINLLLELPVVIPVTLAWQSCAALSGRGWLGLVLIALLLPLFSLAFSSLLGWALAALSRRVRKKALFSTVFSLLFLALYFYLYSRINLLLDRLVQNGAAAAEKLSGARPLWWLGRAVAEGHLPSLALGALFLLLPFAAVYVLLSRTFIKTVTSHRGAARVEYRARAMKPATPSAALFRRELNRFLTSSSYMVNAGLGLVLLIAGAVALPLAQGRLEGALAAWPQAGPLLFPGLLLAVCTLITTVTISAASVSLEGGSLWILQSLPVSSGQALRAKLKLHLALTLPPVLLACASVALTCRPRGEALMACFLLPLAFALLLALLGLTSNLRHPNLSWTNESQAVKNGVSIIVAVALSWGLLLGTAGLIFLLSLLLSLGWALLLISALLLAAAGAVYRWLMRRGAAIFSSL